MKCPHCEKDIPGSPCTGCGGLNPQEATYCMECGLLLKEEPEEAVEHDDALDLDNRVLCPDGTCTGIMVNGRCTECGKAFDDDKKSDN